MLVSVFLFHFILHLWEKVRLRKEKKGSSNQAIIWLHICSRLCLYCSHHCIIFTTNIVFFFLLFIPLGVSSLATLSLYFNTWYYVNTHFISAFIKLTFRCLTSALKIFILGIFFFEYFFFEYIEDSKEIRHRPSFYITQTMKLIRCLDLKLIHLSLLYVFTYYTGIKLQNNFPSVVSLPRIGYILTTNHLIKKLFVIIVPAIVYTTILILRCTCR